MIKIRRNCKEIEGSLSERNRRENKAKTEQKQGKNRGLRDFAASAKSALCCKTSSQPNCPLCENFCSCETNFGTRVPFRSTVNLISQLGNDCEVPKREKSQFRNQSSILKSISQLQNHFLAHECHLEASYTHFAAAKPLHLKILQRAHHELTCCNRTLISANVGHISITSRSSNYVYYILFQILGIQESISSNGAQFGVETKKLWPFEDDCAKLNGNVATAPILLLLDTFLKHFLELKLCILYLVLNLGNSGVQRFKWYAIWR